MRLTLGLLLGSLSLITVNVMFVNNRASFALLALAGANVPVADMPAILQGIAQLLPLTRGTESARRIVAGASLAEVTPLLAGELAVGAAYFLVGYACFRWTEIAAKRRGTLERV